jgi:hypothetical protein
MATRTYRLVRTHFPEKTETIIQMGVQETDRMALEEGRHPRVNMICDGLFGREYLDRPTRYFSQSWRSG